MAPGINSSPLSGALSSSASKEETLAFYKAQYEQLETELADFQASSKELEAELEKDVEAAEARERDLRKKNETLTYEVDEWKSKCKLSKAEANSAQNALQKEVTALRDQNRTLQLRLRDIEVANDDFERQARNTTTSLEDLESKYNVTLERTVILDGELKDGEQERETLRIEVQRLRDELSDLKVEAEIRSEKLRLAESTSTTSRHARKVTPPSSTARPASAVSANSPSNTVSSSTSAATPPAKSVSSTASGTETPPTPPTFDPAHIQPAATSTRAASARPSTSNTITPRASNFSSRTLRQSRIVSTSRSPGSNTRIDRRSNAARPDASLVPSSSLSQIRGLIGKMERLEQRVQTARSKLPASNSTPPRSSPRPGSSMSQASIPATVTVRSAKKRPSASLAHGSIIHGDQDSLSQSMRRPSSRLSLGMPPPPSNLRDFSMYPAGSPSRPSSRSSIASRQSLSSLQAAGLSSLPHTSSSRPTSRQSVTSSQTHVGHYPTQAERSARPRSSMGTIAAHTQPPRPRSSIGGAAAQSQASASSARRRSQYLGLQGSHLTSKAQRPDDEEDVNVTPTPNRASILGKDVIGSSIPMPHSAKRASDVGLDRRTSLVMSGPGAMLPPSPRRPRQEDLDETY